MQRSLYVCRSCISRLDTEWRRGAFLAQRQRWLAHVSQVPASTRQSYANSIDPSSEQRTGGVSNSPVRTDALLDDPKAARRVPANIPPWAPWDWRRKPPKQSAPGILSSNRQRKRPSSQKMTVSAKLQWRHLLSVTRREDLEEAKSVFRTWKRYLYKLHRALDWDIAPLRRRYMQKSHLLPGWAAARAMITAAAVGSVQEVRKGWLEKPEEDRKRQWAGLMMATLYSYPHRATLILEATYEDSVTPQYAVRDVLQFLAERLEYLPNHLKRTAAEELCGLLRFLLQTSPKGHVQVRQFAIFNILVWLELPELKNFYHDLESSGHRLHYNTLLHFARRFAREAEHKGLAMHVLQTVLETSDFNVYSPQGTSICTSIIAQTTHWSRDKMAMTPAETFEKLVAMGMKNNVITYTAIIRNLCLSGDMDTAWKVFRLMLRHGHEPDANVYSTLMNGALLCKDYDALLRIFGLAYTKGIRDPVVCNDLIHSIVVRALHESRRRGKRSMAPMPVPAFRPVLQTYTKFFDKAPLQELLPIDLEEFLQGKDSEAVSQRWEFISDVMPIIQSLAPWKEEELLQPTAYTLAPVVTAYVRSLSDPYYVVAFYSHFRKLLNSGHPVATLMVERQWTLVHDTVIKALMQWPDMVQIASDVVSDMLKEAIITAQSSSSPTAPVPASPTSEQTGPLARHPPPSIFTWSILLHGFMRHKQTEQAEKTLRLMRRHGVEPSLETWNTVVAGYARTQSVDDTVNALRRLESAGFAADDYTLRAFSYLSDKRGALDAMDGIINKRKAAQELMRGEAGDLLDDGARGKKGDKDGSVVDEQELRVMDSELDEMWREAADSVSPKEDWGWLRTSGVR